MLRSVGEGDSVDRGVALVGRAAAEWLAQLGYEVPSGTGYFRAGGDSIRGRSFALSRLWHEAPLLLRGANKLRGGGAVSVVVEGEMVVSHGTTRFTVKKGEGFIASLNSAITLEARGAVGTIELRVDGSFSRRFGVADINALQLLGPELEAMTGLISLANPTLASRGGRRRVTWSFTRTALENMVAALVAEARDAPADSLVERALEEIRLWSDDPAFDVVTLATTLKVTPRWLQMVFAEHGLTPRQAIRIERTRKARQTMKAHLGITLDEVARRTGFPSARALRDALKGFPELSVPPSPGRRGDKRPVPTAEKKIDVAPHHPDNAVTEVAARDSLNRE
ncbi:helix-turn-helix domain-containing protein [Rathayibacter toxicus]|uniref:AraC family transcriptional regulator n=1 Tax=Rathayibacter toxicus TaxID=145458 RepID=A0A0C5BIQ7_9MICO|nr:helix-turn-helix domain-containing protein [Rathayibacter toxicus]AJM78190.1 hypothetical protein TI83_10155 [Rathayibacter toxicus]ALS57530.1 hypothetical protein APU90_06905 [Rathayibacter toxicus]KKM46767.1 hypothetical protein VT73_01790 [Rathayibacter toxicus]PPG20800.1 AraC family transcriptional regulator [Rathayibacter toxicus]PPG45904.1 AraC family transcriptional regulator [Rathayibacter toxicus]